MEKVWSIVNNAEHKLIANFGSQDHVNRDGSGTMC